jgi:hypothetical protein
VNLVFQSQSHLLTKLFTLVNGKPSYRNEVYENEAEPAEVNESQCLSQFNQQAWTGACIWGVSTLAYSNLDDGKSGRLKHLSRSC